MSTDEYSHRITKLAAHTLYCCNSKPYSYLVTSRCLQAADNIKCTCLTSCYDKTHTVGVPHHVCKGGAAKACLKGPKG